MIDLTKVVWPALAMTIACGGAPPPVASPDGETSRLLPNGAPSDDWIVAEGPIGHDADTLYEYLNGGAERFVAQGLQWMEHARYQRRDDPDIVVTLAVYEMNDALGAFGVFRAGRAPAAAPRPWGCEGYRSGPIAAAWNDKVFIRGESDTDVAPAIDALEQLVSTAAGAAHPDCLPAILDILPDDHRVPLSERYVARDLLGHDFLPGGIIATYTVDGRTAELFVSDLGDERAAAAALALLHAHHAQWATVEGTVQVGPNEGFSYRDALLGEGVVLAPSGWITGLHGDLEPADRDAIIEEVIQRLELVVAVR